MSLQSTVSEPRHGVGDDRRARILEGAFKVFMAYGFSRTTMDDIAKAAEISRPALYLVFRNKTDIYRALAGQFLEQALREATEVLARPSPLRDRLAALLENVLFCMMQEIEGTPHGREILDMKNSLAGDIIADWRERLDGVLADAIAQEARSRGADLAARGFSAGMLASMFFDACDGMKLRITDPRTHLDGTKQLVNVIEATLRP